MRKFLEGLKGKPMGFTRKQAVAMLAALSLYALAVVAVERAVSGL